MTINYSPINSLVFQVQENVSFVQDQAQFVTQLQDIYNKAARAINARDISLYTIDEILNGQKFIANDSSQRYVYRKTFQFTGALLTFPHNIVGATSFTRIYGTIQTAADSRPLPYVDAAAVTNQVSVLVNGANIVITNGATAPAIVSGVCVAEYLKN